MLTLSLHPRLRLPNANSHTHCDSDAHTDTRNHADCARLQSAGRHTVDFS